MIIVGGTPEDYGWFEGVQFPDGSGGGSGVPSQPGPAFRPGPDRIPRLADRAGKEPSPGAVEGTIPIKHGQGAGDRALFLYTGGRPGVPPLRRICKSSVFMVGAGPRPARVSRAHPHPPQCAHWGTFPLKGGRLDRNCTGNDSSEHAGAEVEPHQQQFWECQGPVARREFRHSLRFCAPEILQFLTGTRPP